ncbi:hypothetical protein [Actinoplanes sp. NPDC023714]|uniref:hypothetical protein n=1 Tax=Actinoplanes sp. NPDC023714 TaxID=3154322 RepID=UPI0033F659AD
MLLVAVVEMAEGRAEAGQEYEDRVLAILDRHGGVLERRMRDGTGGTEVHVIRFAGREGYDSFMVDPDRLALRTALGDAAPVTRVIEVRDL